MRRLAWPSAPRLNGVRPPRNGSRVLSVRTTRDRDGYDHVFLVSEAKRGGRSEGRLLYWCRLPSGLRVGRSPFDDETRALIERANPQMTFDWPAIVRTAEMAIARNDAAVRVTAKPARQSKSTGGAKVPQAVKAADASIQGASRGNRRGGRPPGKPGGTGSDSSGQRNSERANRLRPNAPGGETKQADRSATESRPAPDLAAG
jgi:hypothetical protein